MTHLSILADLNCAVVWIVSILPLISISLSLFSRSLGTVPRAQITIAIPDTIISHSFFCSMTRSRYFSIFLPFFFCLHILQLKQQNLQVIFFKKKKKVSLVFNSEIGDHFLSQSPRELYDFHFLRQNLACTYAICQYGLTLVS